MMVLVHMIALKMPIENSKTVNLPNLEPPTIASGWDLRGFTHRNLECFRAFCRTSRHPEPSWNTIQPTTTTKKTCSWLLLTKPLHMAASEARGNLSSVNFCDLNSCLSDLENLVSGLSNLGFQCRQIHQKFMAQRNRCLLPKKMRKEWKVERVEFSGGVRLNRTSRSYCKIQDLGVG